jgi:hypothetical protein
MLNARHSFNLVWKRLVAALSLIAAAALAPAAPAPVGGAGAVGSRVGGNGAAVANTASALLGSVAGLVEGSQHDLPFGTPGDGQAKACTPPRFPVIAWVRPERASFPIRAREPGPTHAPRSGPARAPPGV